MKVSSHDMSTPMERFVEDPRRQGPPPEARLMPACEGGAWPEPGCSDATARQQVEFLAAYYRLNVLHDRLRQVRRGEESGGNEAEILATLHEAIELRDALEDRCAPMGFDADPVMVGDLAVNLVFRHVWKNQVENHRRRGALETVVKVPLPEGWDGSETSDTPGIPVSELLADLGLQSVAGPAREGAS